jgi:hypothetical protein
MLHLILGLGLAIYPGTRPQVSAAKPPASHPDTVRAGDAIVAANRLHPFTLVRHLTLTKGDSVRPFGRQTEALTRTTLDGKPVLLDVLVFDTPNGKTIDSSWVDGRTLRPLRSRSHNASRVVRLDFEAGRVRGETTPTTGPATQTDERLPVQPFEWNVFALAVAALPLQPGYRAVVPVYSDRSSRVAWYAVEVLGDTVVARSGGARVPAWEVLAKADSTVPTARFWIAQQERVVDRVLVSEPGVSILYARR